MKYRNKFRYVFILFFLCSGCSDWLEVKPNDQETEEQLFATQGGFVSAVNGVYNNIAAVSLYGKNLSYEMLDIMAYRYNPDKQLTYYTALVSGNYTDVTVTSQLSAIWSKAYQTILNCNVVLKNVEKQRGIVLTEKEYHIFRGELLALRAFLHFDLLRLFGPVYSQNPSALAIVYNESVIGEIHQLLPANVVVNDYILRDIDEAVGLLKENDPVVTDGPLASDGVDNTFRYRQLRLNYYAALALKARILLYAGDKTEAYYTAVSLIKDEKVKEFFPFVDPTALLTNTSTPDRVFSTETLFGFYNKDRDLYDKNSFDPANAGTTFLQPRSGFVENNLFGNETADYRFQSQWTPSTTVGVTGNVFCKYKAIDNGELFYATYFPLIRLSEVYYIAAEACDNITEAFQYLNTIRQARGLPVQSGTISVLKNTLRMEYLREFLGEGQIFFMYKRLNQGISIAENGMNATTVPAGDKFFVLPLPESENAYK